MHAQGTYTGGQSYKTRELLHCRSRQPLDRISCTAPVCEESTGPISGPHSTWGMMH